MVSVSTTTTQIQKVIDLYFKAWKTQDIKLLSQIFTKHAVYRVKPFGKEEHIGLDAISQYWLDNPVAKQVEPRPQVITQSIASDKSFIEWETSFLTPGGAHKVVRGILLLEFRNGLVQELREYYSSMEM